MVSNHTNNWQFLYNLQLPQIYMNTDLCKTIRNTPLDHQIYHNTDLKQLHWSQRSKNQTDCHHNKLDTLKTMYHQGLCIHGLQWHHVLVFKVRSPPEQAASVILVQATPRIFKTHGPSVSHICINARMTPANPLLQSSGPNPGMIIWL